MSRLELAVYGKGGIGKSTMSANLSVAMAASGRKVMQIGCDPKHDSTRLVMHGEQIPTVLEYLRDHDKVNGKVEEVLRTGSLGIGCIEAGGPRPGVGCAGRGIISSFEFLEMHHAKDPYDLVLYDVLGDVVCGGFAVPVRREYADAIFLVTSGEYMALYAANNILRGIRNFDGDSYKRVAGIIYNERKITDEDGRVARFAKAVGLPICAKVPRSNNFAKAEEENRTVMELTDADEEQEIFRKLAAHINHELVLYPALPLEDDELERVVLGTGKSAGAELVTDPASSLNESPTKSQTSCAECSEASDPLLPDQPDAKSTGQMVSADDSAGDKADDKDFGKALFTKETPAKRLPLYGCAFNGAATAAIHLTDALIIAHSPRACAFYTWQNITSSGRKNLFNRGILMPSAISPNFACTDMGQAEAVFGGNDKLRECLNEAMKRKPGAIVIISSCVSGIIGDDIKSLEELSTPDCPIITIEADGVIAGDYMEGIRLCMNTLADKLIDKNVKPVGKLVNLINETGVANNTEVNYRIIRDLLGAMGIKINSRFLGDSTAAEIKNFLAAPLNLLATDAQDSLALKAKLQADYGCKFLDSPFPIGFTETKRFLTQIAEFFDCTELVPAIVEEEERNYNAEIERLRPILQGKKLLVTSINASLDWLLETADAVGMEVVWIGVLNYLRTPLNISKHEKFKKLVSENLDLLYIRKQIEELKPDLVLSNYTSLIGEGNFISDSLFMTQTVGFHSAVHVVSRWAELFAKMEEKPNEGEWQDDRELFEKYYG